ncbi:MAG: hypothetical protein U1F37_09325 [Alphaproteobacteria bacterium]
MKLSDLKGKLVVLNGATAVLRAQALRRRQHAGAEGAARALGVTWITIVSSAPGEQGRERRRRPMATAERNAEAASSMLPIQGQIGRLAARVTPHMFIVGTDGALLYKGAIDSIRSSRQSDIPNAKNYVAAALGEINGGKPVADADTVAYGCTIHYKEVAERSTWAASGRVSSRLFVPHRPRREAQQHRGQGRVADAPVSTGRRASAARHSAASALRGGTGGRGPPYGVR